MDMAVHLTQSDREGVKNSVYPPQWTDGSDDMLWNGNEEAEYGRSECEEDEDMTMDTKNNNGGHSDSDW